MKGITQQQRDAWNFERSFPKFKNFYGKYKTRYKSEYTGDYDLEYEKNLRFLRSILIPIYHKKLEPLNTLTMSQRFHLMMEPMKQIIMDELVRPSALLDLVKRDHHWNHGAVIEIPFKES